MSRLLIDLSTLVRWHGPPVGIARCQQKYADYAFRHIENVQFTLFDPRTREFRSITKAEGGEILNGKLKVDMTMMPDLNKHRRHFVDRIPARLRPAYWWITKTRRTFVSLLERWRLRAGISASANRIERLQAHFITKKYHNLYYSADGTRNRCPRFDDLVGPAISLGPGDTTLAIQTDWIHTDIAAIKDAKRTGGSRHVILCHDIIPIQFPEWYSAPDVAGFKTYYDLAFETADRVMFTSNQTSKDATAYCKSLNIEIRDSAVVPMGSDIAPKMASGVALPPLLESDKYALFVSTVEPRKNHRLLVEAWRGLVQSGVVSRSGYKLVFVGRRGWMMGSFFRDIADDPVLKKTVIHLENVDDAKLARLYLDAGFCLYPPKFEGFGLPIIEALSYGKALLVANAGPMPEIAGDFAIAIDPDSPQAWSESIAKWILQPAERQVWTRRASEEYRPLTWDHSAKLFFEKVLEARMV